MKKRISWLIGVLLWMAVPAIGYSQKGGDALPPFKVLQTNGRFLQAGDLDKSKPVVLIYFAPDCAHCQTLLDGVFKNMTVFQKTQLVLVTFKPQGELQLFERQYNTAAYANVKAGTEGTTYFLRNYYKLSTTPFTAVYNNGTLVCSFRSTDTPVTDIINCVKSLKK
jgi:thiol-disulfide isomerase/thioredoxin